MVEMDAKNWWKCTDFQLITAGHGATNGFQPAMFGADPSMAVAEENISIPSMAELFELPLGRHRNTTGSCWVVIVDPPAGGWKTHPCMDG